jgi:ABC-type glycerol-3-phosphate transport system substrate-binding protein
VRPVRRAIALSLCLLACAACGGGGHETARQSRAARALAEAEASREYPSPPAPRQTTTVVSPSAVEAIAAFATAYINWDAQTVSEDLRALAAASVGQARSAMVLAAAGTAADYELQRGGIANHGAVEAVAPLPGRPDQYVVVTLESTTATNTAAYQGLRPAWHVALATVAQLGPGRWVVSGWQPES